MKSLWRRENVAAGEGTVPAAVLNLMLDEDLQRSPHGDGTAASANPNSPAAQA